MHHLGALLRLVTSPSPAHAAELTGILVVLGTLAYLAGRLSITAIVSVGIIAEVFAGNWVYIPLPIPVDRVLIAGGFLLLALKGTRSESTRKLILNPIHLGLLGISAYVFANGLASGTILHSYGFYAWLDRLGVIPFLMFTFAPTFFGNRKQRQVLVVAMVGLGLYLGYDAAVEGLKLQALVFPKYINNTAIGITPGRARGPSLSAFALGLNLLTCAVFSLIASREWTRPRARYFALFVAAIDLLGIFFTLTRSIWLGAFIAIVVGMGLHRDLRRYLPRVLVASLVGIAGILAADPRLATKALSRFNTSSSIWDRYNTYTAALRAVEAHPLFGIGWQTFETNGISYFREAASYPLSGLGLEVHDLFLSHLAEIGIPAAVAWAVALIATVGGAIVRPGPEELYNWRVALLTMFVAFLIVAGLNPLAAPLPNLTIWMMAGIVSIERYSEPREDGADRQAIELPMLAVP